MASNFPEPTTPSKIMTITSDGVISSPSSRISMIHSEGVPIQVLKTPTKTTVVPLVRPAHSNSQNANSQPSRVAINASPSKVLVKLDSPTVSPLLVQSHQILRPQSTGTYQGPAGAKVQYVRLVSASNAIKTGPVRMTPNSVGEIRSSYPQTTQSHTLQTVKMIHSQQAQQVQGPTTQRLILPAGTQAISITGGQSLSQLKAQLPPGTTIITSGPGQTGTQGQVLALVPGNMMSKMTQQPTIRQIQPSNVPRNEQLTPNANTSAALQGHHSIKRPSPTAVASPLLTAEGQASKQKKPCNCTKSQCLKLYCDCFANGEFCSNCNCNNCYNNLEHEEERQKAIKQCLDRNPLAFHPKIGKGNATEIRRHQKGCNCKRSGCLKNYCECYEAKIPCGSMCKCVGCKNYEESSERKTLMHLADAAEVRTIQQAAAKSKLSSQIGEFRPSESAADRNLNMYLRKDVIQGILDCVLAQCHEAETAKCKESTTEKLVLEEFGRCLTQVIQAASKSKTS